MRKITLSLSAFLLVSMLGYGQQEIPESPSTQQEIAEQFTKFNRRIVNDKVKQSTFTFNFFQDLVDIWSVDWVFFRSTLYRDSSVIVQNGGTDWADAFKHSYGQSFDPTSPLFEVPISPAAKYTVDSIAIPYRYFRPQRGNPDTLVISIFTEDQLNINPAPGWSTPRSYSNAPYDTVLDKGLNPAKEIIYLLEDKDIQESGSGTLDFEVDMDFEAGEIMAATFSYFAGNPVNPGDTLGNSIGPFGPQTRNGFQIEDGRDNDATLDNDRYNMGQWVTTQIAYNILSRTNGWEGSYTPGVAYGNATGVRHMNINFIITYDDFTGINQDAVDRFNFNVYPNPVIDQVTFNHELKQNENASIQVFDVLGNQISDITLSPTAGRTSMDMTAYANGIYFAKLIVDGEVITSSKFIKQ